MVWIFLNDPKVLARFWVSLSLICEWLEIFIEKMEEFKEDLIMRSA